MCYDIPQTKKQYHSFATSGGHIGTSLNFLGICANVDGYRDASSCFTRDQSGIGLQFDRIIELRLT
jgi:hypothetical protein